MLTIEFVRLPEVDKTSIIELMNNVLVRKQMPLLTDTFNEDSCDQFVAAKEDLWNTHGYGPWAFMVDGQFAGWGGLQPENGEADLALVLHPKYWGIGKTIYKKIISRAFDEMKLESVIVLFPPTRTKIRGLFSLGFKEDGKLRIENTQFVRYRIKNPKLHLP